MRSTWTFHSAGELVFGAGAAKQLGERAARAGVHRVLIVTDPPLAAAGILEQARLPLEEAGLAVEVFDKGEPEPSFAAVERCLTAARRFRPDALVGLGGGSNIDLAKIAAVVLAHGGAPRDYVGDDRIPGPVVPLICVPTTAGTGSEVSASCVLTDEEQHVKVGVLSNYLRPQLALVDPLLTLGCPKRVTADSGIDALTHAIEAYTAVDNEHFPLPPGERTVYQGKHPLGDCIAEKAIALAGEHLVTAVEQPDNLAARTGMALAATLGGLAFSNVGVALVHAMEYPVGGAVHCSHGCGNGLLLPYVMRFNLPARKAAFARVAKLLGCQVQGLETDAAAAQAVEAVEKLRERIGIPRRLRDLGVEETQLPTFADKAFAVKRILRVNPRMPSRDEVLEIYRTAW